MKLKDFKAMNCFDYLNIYDENYKAVCIISNYEHYGDDIPNFVNGIGDERTELEKYQFYKDCEVLEIYNADLDINGENSSVDIKIRI